MRVGSFQADIGCNLHNSACHFQPSCRLSARQCDVLRRAPDLRATRGAIARKLYAWVGAAIVMRGLPRECHAVRIPGALRLHLRVERWQASLQVEVPCLSNISSCCNIFFQHDIPQWHLLHSLRLPPTHCRSSANSCPDYREFIRHRIGVF